MRILVLGATSGIGWSLCTTIAPTHDLLLAGRDEAGLENVAEACRNAGAASAEVCLSDLSLGPAAILASCRKPPIDLVMNVASSTSQLRDCEIRMTALRQHVEVDLLAPVQLVRELLELQPKRPLRVLLISTVLAAINSPERAIYGRLKNLQEHCLEQLQQDFPQLKVQIFRVGKAIPPGLPNAATQHLAQAAAGLLAIDKPRHMYGAGGVALLALSNMQPLLLQGLLRLRRLAANRPNRQPAAL
ncbi:MAG: SDR family NAD(P)-dependent oxidoreductase [Bryobacteraceae bacterium]|nr:SDR family NAD(P)-dependent oxidoreductase [Bryobacteraceae bacterium]